jgi:hypothetical protein
MKKFPRDRFSKLHDREPENEHIRTQKTLLAKPDLRDLITCLDPLIEDTDNALFYSRPWHSFTLGG